MRPTTANLILFALASLTAMGLGAALVRLAGGGPSLLRVCVRIVGGALVIVGVMATGHLVWNHLSAALGPRQIWYSAPSFYLALTILLGVSWLWFRQPKNGAPRAVVKRYGYPLLVVALVAGSQVGIKALQKSESRTLFEGVAATRGKMAAEIEFVDVDGAVRRLSALKGNIVLINFWTTACGPCLQEMPTLSALQRKFEKRGFVMAYLSPEAAPVLETFYREHQLAGINGRVTVERPVPAFYQSGSAWPLSFLIRRDGVVEDAWVGAPPPEWLEERIERSL
jgi:thiol-disulfide isomerase/thioredoxin